ncbi:MAG: lipid A deacylase LpxR family protein, partial [Amphritea sp.]|nr:lipid A deacylase LpxR family protein [Amphritea sp.]
MLKTALMATGLAALSPLANAQSILDSSFDNPGTLTFYLENDLFADTDQQYTNGVRVSWVSPDLTSYLEDKSLPAWVRRYNRFVTAPLGLFDDTPQDQEELVRNLVVTLGQEMYTPEDNTRTTIDPLDRPYAGWLYLGMGYQIKNQRQLDSATLNVGIVGPASQAKEAQDLVHDIRGIDKFDGWHNQLNNELGLQVVYERKYREPVTRIKGALEYDTIYHGGISVGNVRTYVNTGAEF